MTSPSWDPQQYERFGRERARPFADLVARIPHRNPRLVVDLGCGPGTSTATLPDRWSQAYVLGLDSSADMLRQAQPRSVPGRLEFRHGDIMTWKPDPASVDVIISNAALQWVPEHPSLFGRWIGGLRDGGSLAFQVPAPPTGDTGAPDPGEIFRNVATDPRWVTRLAPVIARPGPRSASPVRPVGEYLDRLVGLGCTVDAWETTYHHVLPGPDAVLEWSAGTGLRPYLDALADDPATLEAFRAAVAARLRAEYPPQSYGTVLPFHRIFVVATR